METEPIYGVWEDRKLLMVGTLEKAMETFHTGCRLKLITPRNDTRRPNKWRDMAAAALRDAHGYDYEQIAYALGITVGMAQGAVSRVRCGRYADDA